jgi:hypothetical protein
MGKAQEGQAVPARVGAESLDQNAQARWCGNCGFGCCCGGVRRLIGIRCLLVLLLSAAVFLSAIFWLPPFLRFADQENLDLDSKFKGGFLFFFFYFIFWVMSFFFDFGLCGLQHCLTGVYLVLFIGLFFFFFFFCWGLDGGLVVTFCLVDEKM